MNSLKLVITVCATIFFTTAVMAHTTDEVENEIPIDSSLVEKTQISAAAAASLFTFSTLPKAKRDTTIKKDDRTSFHFIELISTYL